MYHNTRTPQTPPRPNSVIDADARKLAEAVLNGADAEYVMEQYETLNSLEHEKALREIETQESKRENEHEGLSKR